MYSTSPILADLQRELRELVFPLIKRLRFVIAPMPLLLGGWVILIDPTPWRRVTISLLWAMVLVAFSVLPYLERVSRVIDVRRIIWWLAVFVHPVILVATGGVYSPVVTAMTLVTFIGSTLLTRKESGYLVASQLVTLLIVVSLECSRVIGTLIPLAFLSSENARPRLVWTVLVGAMVAMMLFALREIGSRIQLAYFAVLRRSIESREEALRLHREQISDMTQLSGEIAHELKNPLASVKGLAALLERRSEGVNVEPFLVMRRELDRMQATLEEFLNFSRPLVPLNLALASLDALVRDVCALHEGMSESKRVSTIVARSETVTVLCDARKVRQILINLVQNAIEASAPGTTIVLNVLRTDEAARVVVEDEGTGVDSFVGARAFDAGVTSKTGGSGLGLNVARGLARQHGGDVTLENRSPRGCRATLTLPLTDTRSSTICATTDGTPAVTSEGK